MKKSIGITPNIQNSVINTTKQISGYSIIFLAMNVIVLLIGISDNVSHTFIEYFVTLCIANIFVLTLYVCRRKRK